MEKVIEDKYGLDEDTFQEICRILSRYGEVQEAILYLVA